jgi:hypothetical protein
MGGETAMIADPRNDEHLILSGMQAAFLMFHNNVVDMLRDDGEDRRVGAGDDRADARLFARARQISTPLFQLPLAAIASHDLPISLPQRNLLRHITWSMPSGQDIARFIRVPQLSPAETGLSPFGLGLDTDTPLWYYALKEAEVMADGLTLGPVGGRVVGEVFIGLLQLDQDSYLNARNRWRPTLPQRNGRVTGDFKMIDFLTFAGVAPDQRGQ